VKTTFYHAVFNGYDKPKPPQGLEHGLNYVVLAGHVDPCVATCWNRQSKIVHPPAIGDISVYLDGNIGFGHSAERTAKWAENVLGDADIAICRHANRKCAYVEIEACIARKKITEEEAIVAKARLEDGKLPRNFGLWECGIIVRRVDTNWLAALQAMWWKHLCESNVWRDQIWLPLVLHQFGARLPAGKFKTIEMDVRSNPIFTFKPHR
jgi:hypothetical protein